MELRGGPLDGRTGHVYDALEALWVARLQGNLVVRSGRHMPVPIADAEMLGRYVLDASTGALGWHALGGETLLTARNRESRHVVAGKTQRPQPFGAGDHAGLRPKSLTSWVISWVRSRLPAVVGWLYR